MAAVLNRVRTLARFAENKRKYDEGCASFTADTWVHTPQGLKAIQQLNAGDRIYTRDEHHYSQQISTIERTFGRTAPGYYELNIAGTLIQATPEHPFWVQGRGWVNTVNLKPGIVLSAWSGDVVLDEVRYINQAVPVYNFKVKATELDTLQTNDWSAYRPADTRKKTRDKDLNHSQANYFISPLKLWVHNQNNDVCDLSQRRGQNEKRQVDEILDSLPNNKRERFAKLLDSNPDFKSSVLNDPDLAGAWNVLDDAGFDQVKSTDTVLLQNILLWPVSLPDNQSQIKHIFRDATGHIPDTANNRQLLLSTSNDLDALLGTDRFGNVWSAKILSNGSQAWVQSRNGIIQNGGINLVPFIFNDQTGLSKP